MENRSRGEETYVIINTTGEPLSPTENIKPILLGNSKLTKEQVQLYSDQWHASFFYVVLADWTYTGKSLGE